MPKFHTIHLDAAQRLLLEKPIRSGAAAAPTSTDAAILLEADDSDRGQNSAS